VAGSGDHALLARDLGVASAGALIRAAGSFYPHD
jgi:hypothetical protein